MSDIPTEVYHEILRRLPVNTLFQIRSVCKTWRRVIDDPKFVKLYTKSGAGDDGWILQRSKYGKLFLLPVSNLVYHKPTALSYMNGYDESDYECSCNKSLMDVCPDCYLEFVSGTNVKVLVCPGVPHIRDLPVPNCNGLIFVSTSKPNMDWVIWNPFTGESLKLPCWDEIPNDYKKGYYDHPVSGIGFDEASDDYKVVRIVKSCTFIYSVKSGVWRRTYGFPDECNVPDTRDGAFVNGALHWFARSGSCIVAIDLTTERYWKIPLPLEITSVLYPCSFDLVALSGFLFLTRWNCNQLFDMWMVKDYGGSDDKLWTKMMSLERWGEFTWQDRPIAYLKNKNLILIQRGSEKVWWYDVEKQILKDVSLVVDQNNNSDIYDSFSSQVIPANLVRLQHRANDEGNSSTRKRKRGEPDMLEFKILFGDPINW